MNKVILYSNNCPKCLILRKKLNEKNILFEESSNTTPLLDRGIMGFPGLEVDGDIKDFIGAVSWVNAQSKKVELSEEEIKSWKLS